MKIELEYPSSYDEITLGQYQAYLRLFDDDEQYELTKNDLFKIFVNVSPKILPANKVDEICVKVSNALNELNNSKGFEAIIEHNGVKYGFIPNFDRMTYGENEDLITTLNDHKMFHKAMEVLYRPITKQFRDLYDIESYVGYDVTDYDFKRLPAKHFINAMVFFYNLIDALEIHIRSYSKKRKVNGHSAAVDLV